MDVSLDIPYKLSYYCMSLLYELTLSLYSIHSKVYSSLKNCFYPQLKAHCKSGSHPSHSYHHRTDILMMISIHCYQTSFFLIALTKQFFICFSFLLVLFFRTFSILMKSFHESCFSFYKLYQILNVWFPYLFSSDSLYSPIPPIQ